MNLSNKCGVVKSRKFGVEIYSSREWKILVKYVDFKIVLKYSAWVNCISYLVRFLFLLQWKIGSKCVYLITNNRYCIKQRVNGKINKGSLTRVEM